MGFNIGSVFMMVGIVSCLISVAHAAQGNGVFYDPPYTPSKCFGNSNKGGLVAGVSDALWNGGAACGRRYRVSCVREDVKETSIFLKMLSPKLLILKLA
ncbi:hypothetical protein OIU84_010497 [Salix udensis]|uniref:Expansin-like EG45 domain-containing protein n=1 Tax=Salix udensis TaxID=889485 RepID=A0AAD6NW59_9ROSI|nr:hypothetical protein OIU84_010497 [Salix udensis]